MNKTKAVAVIIHAVSPELVADPSDAKSIAGKAKNTNKVNLVRLVNIGS